MYYTVFCTEFKKKKLCKICDNLREKKIGLITDNSKSHILSVYITLSHYTCITCGYFIYSVTLPCTVLTVSAEKRKTVWSGIWAKTIFFPLWGKTQYPNPFSCECCLREQHVLEVWPCFLSQLVCWCDMIKWVLPG